MKMFKYVLFVSLLILGLFGIVYPLYLGDKWYIIPIGMLCLFLSYQFDSDV